MELTSALDQAVADSFADMAFMDAMVVSEDGGAPASVPDGQLVYISFGRPLSGFLTLQLGVATKKRLVENVYGQGWEELPGAQVDDCLMELANVVAGNFLLIFGEGENRHAVALPQVLYDEEELPEWDNLFKRYYRVDDEHICVFLAYSGERGQS